MNKFISMLTKLLDFMENNIYMYTCKSKNIMIMPLNYF